MPVLLTYDVSHKQKEVKQRLKLKGFRDRFKTGAVTYYLPNTTLARNAGSATDAITDLKRAAMFVGVEVERVFATTFEFEYAAAEKGDPHRP